MRWRSGLVLGVAVAATVLLAGARGGAEPASESRPWQRLPDPPLSPRETPTGFWTGKEVILVGGSDAPPCPPSAECEPPTIPPLSDGAAYDPDAGTWRTIPDAPVAFEWGSATVTESTAYLWIPGNEWRPESPSAFLAYRIADDRWDELPLPPGDLNAYSLMTAGEALVAYSWGDEPREIPDLIFDPASERWSELPDDPFSPGFDRLVHWDGDELLLLDHEIVPNPDEHLPLRGAALDLETGVWRVLDDPDAALARTGWTPELQDDFVHAGSVSASHAEYRLRSGIVLDEETGSWLHMPDIRPFGSSDYDTTGVTAGTDLFTYVGVTWDTGAPGEFFGQLHSAAWLWSPRAPVK